MPGFNQRGPMNEGPMTGRGMGQCSGAYTQDMGAPAYGYGQGRGMGMGRRGGQPLQQGMGRGMGRGAQMQMTPQATPPPTKASLAVRAQQLEAELESIQNALKQMGSE